MARTSQRSSGVAASDERGRQWAYSELQAHMLDETGRRKKAAKIVRVIGHFLGRADLSGLRVLDIGCSAGFVSDVLQSNDADVIGIDIDVPGLTKARARFGSDVSFICGDGAALPLPAGSIDVVVFNHIYEHVVDADAVMAEIRRVLANDGLVYLGLANRLGVVEPHYRLPFLSWLPRNLADRYVRAFGRADNYYERFRTRAGLAKMCAGLTVWDYTYTVLSDAEAFEADEMVPPRLRNAPSFVWKAVSLVMPTFVWVGTSGGRAPAGPPMRVAPELVRN